MLLEIITNTNFLDILFISLFLKKRGKKNLKPETKTINIFTLVDIDVQGEHELLGEFSFSSPSEEGASDAFVEEEDLDTEDILALAEQEEARCVELQDEVDAMRWEDEERKKNRRLCRDCEQFILKGLVWRLV